MSVYVSLQPRFNVQQQYLPVHVLDGATGVQFGKGDSVWCTKCYIYLLVNVEKEQRYYLSAKAVSTLEELAPRVPI